MHAYSTLTILHKKGCVDISSASSLVKRNMRVITYILEIRNTF